MATAEITVCLVDYAEVKELLEAARAVEDAIEEFGYDPERIGESLGRLSLAVAGLEEKAVSE